MVDADRVAHDLAGRLRSLAGLRNLLVHLYGDIDDDRVAREAATGLHDLNALSQAVARLLETPPDGRP